MSRLLRQQVSTRVIFPPYPRQGTSTMSRDIFVVMTWGEDATGT